MLDFKSFFESSLRDIIKPVPQDQKYHKEGDVFTHTRLVRKGIQVAISLLRTASAVPESPLSNLTINLTPTDIKLLQSCAWMHDIGKSTATTAGEKKWKRGMPVFPSDEIRAAKHETPKYYKPAMGKLGNNWKDMYEKTNQNDIDTMRFVINNHMSLMKGKYSDELSMILIDPATGKYRNDRKVIMLLLVFLMDQMGRYGSQEKQFGLANGIKTIREIEKAANIVKTKYDAIQTRVLAQKEKARRETELGPDEFRKVLAARGVPQTQIEKAVKAKFNL